MQWMLQAFLGKITAEEHAMFKNKSEGEEEKKILKKPTTKPCKYLERGYLKK